MAARIRIDGLKGEGAMRVRRSWVMTGLVGALAAVAVITPLAVPAAAAVAPNIDTSVAPGNEAEDAIAVNLTNPSNVVIDGVPTASFNCIALKVSMEG